MNKYRKKTKICYLGPKHSYHYIALKDFINNFSRIYFESVYPQSVNSFDELFNKVREGNVGIIAVENNIGGLVFDNKKIIENEFKIIHKIKLKIDHCLMVYRGVKFKDINKILLHPQVKKQTSKYLDKQNWEQILTPSTSFGASKINKNKLKDTATIGSKQLAEHYDLSILKAGLSNKVNNITTFYVFLKSLS